MTNSPNANKMDPKVDGWISDLVGALSDPIVCWPGYEDDKPPDDFLGIIKIQRLLENMVAIKENREPLGTDAEAAWYLSTVSLAQPISENWCRVYRYCFTKTMATLKKEVPTDLRFDTLDDYDLNYHLLPLKRWIYRVRSEHRKATAKVQRQEQHEQIKQTKELMQPRMFEL
jgi:hypothetical protein